MILRFQVWKESRVFCGIGNPHNLQHPSGLFSILDLLLLHVLSRWFGKHLQLLQYIRARYISSPI